VGHVGKGHLDDVKNGEYGCEHKANWEVKQVAQKSVVTNQEGVIEGEYCDPLKGKNHKVERWLCTHHCSKFLVILHAWKEPNNNFVVQPKLFGLVISKS